MGAGFSNVYDDAQRATAYAKLGFPRTYYLGFRDLPDLFRKHVRGTCALDFGCGTGRSSRFLREHGFDVIGVDISEPMVERARALDPEGDYRLVPGDDLSGLEAHGYDLVLSAFTFDNVPAMEKKVDLFRRLARLLDTAGRIVNIVSSPEIYVNEWASFTTKDYPENRRARSGDPVRIVMLDVDDGRPVEDIVWSDEDWGRVYVRTGLETLAKRRPLATGREPFEWVSETTIAPWVIYVLAGRSAA